MKNSLKLVLLFFLCNGLGSTIGPLFFVLSLKYKFVDINDATYDAIAFQNDMVVWVWITWLICAVFSFALFFVHGIWRKIFMFSPIVIPFIYGIIQLLGHI